MAITGVLLFGFVVFHMLGNLQIFLGQDALNAYAATLQKLPELLWPARLILLTALLLHILVAIQLSFENKKARPQGYVSKGNVQASYASRTMMLSGVIVLLFIIYHLAHFTFGRVHSEVFHLTDRMGRHDVYSMVVLSYQNVWISSLYILSMLLLCLHLSHGFFSLFQSLGLSNEKFQPGLALFSKIFALIIFIGNSAIPVAAYFHFLKLPMGS